jgi:putative endonuclease
MLWAGFTYIMTSRKNKVLYTGATSDLHTRLFEHKSKLNPGFTARYQIDKLVYYECFLRCEQAFAREEQIKSWSRQKKIALIESINPEWNDLSPEVHYDRIVRYPSPRPFEIQ